MVHALSCITHKFGLIFLYDRSRKTNLLGLTGINQPVVTTPCTKCIPTHLPPATYVSTDYEHSLHNTCSVSLFFHLKNIFYFVL